MSNAISQGPPLFPFAILGATVYVLSVSLILLCESRLNNRLGRRTATVAVFLLTAIVCAVESLALSGPLRLSAGEALAFGLLIGVPAGVGVSMALLAAPTVAKLIKMLRDRTRGGGSPPA